MPIFEVDIRGAQYEIEAPDESQAATLALKMSQQPQHFAFDGSDIPNYDPKTGMVRDPYGASFVGQSLSGFNEGLANTLGAPVDLTNFLLGLGAKGINALAGTDLQVSDAPFAGSEFFKKGMGPAIRAPTDDPQKQFTRRTMQSVGAAAIPGLGVAGTAAKPVQSALGAVGAGGGGGIGAATANYLFPGNPTADMIGELVGSLGTVGATATLRRMMANRQMKAATPSLDDLRSAKNAAYQRVDDMGVAYSPKAVDDLITGIEDEMTAAHLNPTRHPKAYSMLEDIKSKAITGQTPSLTQIDQLRQIIRRDVANAADGAESYFGRKMVDNIDEFVDSAGPRQVIAGNAEEGSAAIKQARELNRRVKGYERISEQDIKAARRANSTGSGGNIDNTTRQNIRAILDDPRKSKFYTGAERSAMEKVVAGTKPQNFARQVGKLSPSGNGLQQALALGATAYNPAMAILPGSGLVAKALSDRATRGNVDDLLRLIATGKPFESAPFIDDSVKRMIEAAMSAVAANASAQ